MKISTNPRHDAFFFHTTLEGEISLSFYPLGSIDFVGLYPAVWYMKSVRHGCYKISDLSHAVISVNVASDGRVDICYEKEERKGKK